MRTGIGDPLSLDLGELCQVMFLGLARGEDVFHTNPADDEGVRKKGAMAFPRYRLRAHDGGMCPSREPHEAVQAHAEFR